MNDEQLKTSKAYQALNQEEPIGSPPELDAAILAQAHKAVQVEPQALTTRKHLTLRWGAPIASAALVVLSVTVFIVMPELEQQRNEPALQALVAKEKSAKREKQSSQRNMARAMKKAAPAAPMANLMSAERFSGAEMEDLAMDSLQVEESIDWLSADEWVKNILNLIEQGDWANADKQFQAFAKHYPEHGFNKKYAQLKQE